MTKLEAIVMDQIISEEKSIQSIEETLSEAEARGIVIKKDEISWVSKEERKKFFDKLIKAVPIYRERIEQLEQKWVVIEEKLG